MPKADVPDHNTIRRDLVRTVIKEPLYTEIDQARKEGRKRKAAATRPDTGPRLIPIIIELNCWSPTEIERTSVIVRTSATGWSLSMAQTFSRHEPASDAGSTVVRATTTIDLQTSCAWGK